MTAEQQARAAWYEAHDALRAWVQPHMSLEIGRSMASKACGLWVRSALDGQVPFTCAYALLFEAMQNVVAQEGSLVKLGVPEVLDELPDGSRTLLPYQMSKLYWDICKAGRLLKWDKQICNRASKAVSGSWPSGPVHWASLDPDGIGVLAKSLGRRAVVVLSEHHCLACEVCVEMAGYWDDEDQRTERWFTVRRLEKAE